MNTFLIIFSIVLVVYWLIGLGIVFYLSKHSAPGENTGWIIAWIFGPFLWPFLINFLIERF